MKWFTLLILFFSFNSFSQNYDRETIRKEFVVSIEDEEIAEKWHTELKDKDLKNDPILEGYRACFYFLMSKHAVFYKKIGYFTDGKKLLEQCINKSPNNVELRFLRISTQKKVPKFLNYHKNIAEDTEFLKKNLNTVKEKPFKEAIKLIIES